MIPAQVSYDANATPPQFTDNEDYRVEPGTHIRVKIMGTRSEVGEMWAIGTVNEDYLGLVSSPTRNPSTAARAFADRRAKASRSLMRGSRVVLRARTRRAMMHANLARQRERVVVLEKDAWSRGTLFWTLTPLDYRSVRPATKYLPP